MENLLSLSAWLTAGLIFSLRVCDMTLDTVPTSSPLRPPQRVQAQYPEYLVAGATAQVPYDPFTKATTEYLPVVVVRGPLAEALAGTNLHPTQLLTGLWPDVIALREKNADGTPGDPIVIFARGFGPLLIAGQPVEGAVGDQDQPVHLR